MKFVVSIAHKKINKQYSYKKPPSVGVKNIIMETTRQEKISRMLQKELGEIFLLYAREIHGVLITVTAVRISPDLGIAHTHLSVFPSDKVKSVLEKVNADTKAIRFDLGKRVRNQLRIVPTLFFHNDDSLDYLENIDNLLKSDPPSPLKEGEEIELD